MGAKHESKKQYIARRKARVRRLYLDERLTPREIATRLVRNQVIETSDESLASPTRLVQSDIAEIRADVAEVREELVRHRSGDADPSVAFDEFDALEAELFSLRAERKRQLLIADGEPNAEGKEAVFVVTMMGAGGEPFQFEKPKWPAGVRQKASKDAATLTEKISKLEVALAEKRRAQVPLPKDGNVTKAEDDIFRVVTSGKSLAELVIENASSPDGGDEVN